MSSGDRLKDKVAIVTGGARGMGAATVRVFVAEGARVLIADMLDEEANRLAAELHGKAAFAHLDVTDEQSWATVVAGAIQSFGRIDVLVNNAGIMLFKTLAETSKAQFERQLNVNLVGSFLGIKAVAPHMIARKSGAIINIASSGGTKGMNGIGAYSSSKWGLRGLSRVAAMELGPYGIRVNTVLPGGINTPMTNMTAATEGELNRHFRLIPMQRIGRPEEVGRVSAFLASDDASYVAGAEYAVDGGETTGNYLVGAPGSPAAAP
jgi:3alpha(or 20beta)-hydroxysteroid dehydrogenase